MLDSDEPGCVLDDPEPLDDRRENLTDIETDVMRLVDDLEHASAGRAR